MNNGTACTNCGEEGTICIDPYLEEVFDLIIITVLCDDCYKDCCQDI